MDANDEVPLGLGLGLGLAEYTPKRENPRKNKRSFCLDLSFPHHKKDCSGISADSSSSLKIVEENCDNCSLYGDKEDDDNNFFKDYGRKKLRLTRDQTTLLEESFKQQPTLNMAQKQSLAERLKLKPRQVEVWFQNRRARTKLKQTEVDCEFLKKNCERLLEENRRLKKELSELRSSLDMEKPQPLPCTPPRGPATQSLPPFFHQNRTAEMMVQGRGGGEKQEAAVQPALMGVVQEP